MPKLSPQLEKKLNKEKEKARRLYWSGLSMRAVALKLDKSHEWVRQALKR
jgi:transposase-like protein